MYRLREDGGGGGQALRAREELLVAGPAVGDGEFGQLDALALHLLRGREHLGLAGNHLKAVLVGAQALEDHVLVVVELLLAGHLHRDGVADLHRAREAQRLADIDGAGAGELGAEHGRDQRAAPHAVGDHLVEHRRVRVLRVDVRRVDVARHDGEELDVLRAQRPGQGRGVADLDLVVRAVLDECSGQRLIAVGQKRRMGADHPEDSAWTRTRC